MSLASNFQHQTSRMQFDTNSQHFYVVILRLFHGLNKINSLSLMINIVESKEFYAVLSLQAINTLIWCICNEMTNQRDENWRSGVGWSGLFDCLPSSRKRNGQIFDRAKAGILFFFTQHNKGRTGVRSGWCQLLRSGFCVQVKAAW